MAHRWLEDRFIAEQIEAAVRPYYGKLDEQELAWMRDRLADLLEREPDARELLSQAHPRDTVESSGERLRPGMAEQPPTEDEQGGAGGR